MELIALIQYGTPVVLLGLIVLVVRLIDQVTALQSAIKKIEDNMVYYSTCKLKHQNIERRVDNLEAKAAV